MVVHSGSNIRTRIRHLGVSWRGQRGLPPRARKEKRDMHRKVKVEIHAGPFEALKHNREQTTASPFLRWRSCVCVGARAMWLLT
jgi:hypothetical protein